MEDVNRWSPVYGKFRRWPTLRDQGHASLKENLEAEPVHPMPIAGFNRPLPEPVTTKETGEADG